MGQESFIRKYRTVFRTVFHTHCIGRALNTKCESKNKESFLFFSHNCSLQVHTPSKSISAMPFTGSYYSRAQLFQTFSPYTKGHFPTNIVHKAVEICARWAFLLCPDHPSHLTGLAYKGTDETAWKSHRCAFGWLRSKVTQSQRCFECTCMSIRDIAFESNVHFSALIQLSISIWPHVQPHNRRPQ